MPEIYRGMALTWSMGRHLASCGDTNLTYDARGRRIGKGGISYTYDSDGKLIYTSKGMSFFYDHSGLFAMEYNGATYFYRKNAQNDVIALLDNSGNVVVNYKYDAWGNCKVLNASGGVIGDIDHIGNINPFRYRSYFYDVESGLYYLNARYYDPQIGRFISPDDISYLDPDTVNGLNLYAYCLNNPVMYSDETGHWSMPKWLAWTISSAAIVGGIVMCATGVGSFLGGMLIAAGANSLINGYINESQGGSFTAGYVGGAISGALCAAGAGLGGIAFAAMTQASTVAGIMGCLILSTTASFTGAFAGNLIGTVATNHIDSTKIDWGKTLVMSTIAGTLNIPFGFASGAISVVAEDLKHILDAGIKLNHRIFIGAFSGATEALCDSLSVLLAELASFLW